MFNHPDEDSFLKTMWEKEKTLIFSPFPKMSSTTLKTSFVIKATLS